MPENAAQFMTDAEIRTEYNGIVMKNWSITEASEAYNDAYLAAQKQLIYTQWLLSTPGSAEETEYAERLTYIERVSGAGRNLADTWYRS